MKRPPGTGSIHRTADGRYRARLPRRYGRRWLEPRATEAEAMLALAAELEALATEDRPHAGPTLAGWGESYIDMRVKRGLFRSPLRERRRWRRYVTATALGATPLVRVTSADVRRWLDDVPGAVATRRNALSLVRGALRWAAERRQIRVDPAHGVLLPIEARTAGKTSDWTWLRAHELAALLDACAGPRQRAIMTLAAYSGLRAGEMWALRWDDIDEADGVIHVRHAVQEDNTIGPPKSGRTREVPLLAPVHTALNAWRAVSRETRSGHVWEGRAASHHPRGYRGDLYKLLDRAELRRVRFHDLRHTCASHLLQGTWAPWIVARPLRLEEVQRWLGHSSITMTQRYSKLAPDGLRGLAVAYETPQVHEIAGDPKGTRMPTPCCQASADLARIAAVGHTVVQAAEVYRRSVAGGDPHAHQRGLDMAAEAARLEEALASIEDVARAAPGR